jgi:hypothetical protein
MHLDQLGHARRGTQRADPDQASKVITEALCDARVSDPARARFASLAPSAGKLRSSSTSPATNISQADQAR